MMIPQVSTYFNVTVGTVAVVLKVVCIFLMPLGLAMCLQCITKLSAMSLSWHGKTPLMFERDINILHVPFAARRFLSIPISIIPIVCLAILLVPAEIIADYGVSSSNRCKPEKLETFGLCGGDFNAKTSFATNLETAYQIEDLQWDEQMLVDNPIRQGARKTCDGSEYYGNRVKRNTSLPIVIYGCSVQKLRIFQANETKLVFGKGGKGAFTDDKVQFKAAINRNMSISGFGAIFDNYRSYSGFLVARHDDGADQSNSALVVEYPDSEHMAEIEKAASNITTYTIPARVPLLAYEVGCRYASSNSASFQTAIALYRYAMLSRSAHRRYVPRINITISGQSYTMVQPLKASDIVKGVYSMKVSEFIGCVGETFVYTECGDYDTKMVIPLIVVFLLIFVVWILVLFITTRAEGKARVPVTKNQWEKLAITSAYDEEKVVFFESEEYKKYRAYGYQRYMGEIELREKTEASGLFDSPFILRKVIFEHQDSYEPTLYRSLSCN